MAEYGGGGLEKENTELKQRIRELAEANQRLIESLENIGKKTKKISSDFNRHYRYSYHYGGWTDVDDSGKKIEKRPSPKPKRELPSANELEKELKKPEPGPSKEPEARQEEPVREPEEASGPAKEPEKEPAREPERPGPSGPVPDVVNSINSQLEDIIGIISKSKGLRKNST